MRSRRVEVRECGRTGVEIPKAAGFFHSLTAAILHSHTCLLLAFLHYITLTIAPLHAADPPLPAAAATEDTASVAVPVDDREAEKQRRAMAGLLALCGIVIGGLVFLIMVMAWGARLRRLARRELPAQKTLQNELWFLRPPKPGEKSGARE